MKYPCDFLDKVLCGNCLELMKYIPDGVIDLVLTDPPYGLGKEGIRGDADLKLFYEVLLECYRVLKKDAWFLTFFSTKHLPKLFENNPFEYFWQIVLYCPNGAVSSPIGYTKYMSCFVFKKGNPKIVKRDKDAFVDTPGRAIEPDEGYIDHPTPKPKRFLMHLLDMFSKEGDVVLDPFLGSGSTAVACILMNRRFIGIEIEKKYCEMAIRRVEKFLPMKGSGFSLIGDEEHLRKRKGGGKEKSEFSKRIPSTPP